MQERLFDTVRRYEFDLHSWSFFSNHYHLILRTETGQKLRQLLSDFHSGSARELNKQDGTPGRKVWFQFWDTELTTQGSYMARLRYVQENAVHHGLVLRADHYPWCSAKWFQDTATAAFRKAIANMKMDRVTVKEIELE
jgi:putative transposase